jgi:hypothetical protein
MDNTTTGLAIQIDGRTIFAQPRPEDAGRLAELYSEGQTLQIEPSSLDTEGHGLSSEIAVDVEGHAITLRLPNTDDAAALRRALAVGALAATIAIGGVTAAALSQAPAAPVAPAQVPAVDAPSRSVDLATLREQRLAKAEDSSGASTGASTDATSPSTASDSQSGTRESRSGPLEFDR